MHYYIQNNSKKTYMIMTSASGCRHRKIIVEKMWKIHPHPRLQQLALPPILRMNTMEIWFQAMKKYDEKLCFWLLKNLLSPYKLYCRLVKVEIDDVLPCLISRPCALWGRKHTSDSQPGAELEPSRIDSEINEIQSAHNGGVKAAKDKVWRKE